MTHKLKQTLLRGMCLAALAGIGLVATPGTARADFITFTVNEGAVGGGTPDTIDFQADLINGLYVANLSLAPGGGCPVGSTSCGTWTESATAVLTKYALGGFPVAGYIGNLEPEGYQIVGSLNSTGTYYTETCGANTCYYFTFLTQTGTLGLDVDSNNTADIALLSASGVADGTGGQLIVNGSGIPTTGSFNSNFLNNTLAANATAPSYWPTLATLQFSTTINGDINAGSTLNLIRGDVSVQFNQVPEPATLTLLSLGLAAGARHIRRRRAVKA
jgi:hypothetical protein